VKIKKLFKKAEEILNSEERSRKEKKKYLKHVVKKLRKYELEATAKLETETDESTREHLKKKISLSHAQRKKGLNLLQDLKKTNDGV